MRAIALLLLLLYVFNIIQPFHKTRIKINDSVINVMIAKTPMQQAMGLQFHPKLNENQAMLFVFNSEDIKAFWMKNTFFDIDIAFLDSDHRIVDIQRMNAKSLDVHHSKEPCLYALETSAGFYERHKIHVGDVLNFGLIQSN